MNILTKVAGIAVVALMLMPVAASAESYYPSYGSGSQQELIAYLKELIAQLQAQLDAQHGGGSGYGLSVQTVGADDVDEDSASLFGNLSLGLASSARVWFEYGESTSFEDESPSAVATGGGQYSFRADVTGLEEDETYYFRAVAEDPSGRREYGSTDSFETDGDGDSDDGDEPDVTTDEADNVENDEAELNGDVDMNEFEDGLVFFVYGTDEDLVEEIEDEYETYDDIDEEDEDLQKVDVDSSLDGDDSYSEVVDDLEEDMEYFFQICVEYEDEDDDETIACGGVEEFDTDEDGSDDDNDEEPDVTTEDAEDIEDDEAELHGEVDMNDFDDGLVFFVFGEDEDLVEEIEDEYDTFDDIDEEDEDLIKEDIDSSLDGSSSYELNVSGLDEDTDYFFQICVEYEDEDDDAVLACGGVEEFTTEE